MGVRLMAESRTGALSKTVVELKELPGLVGRVSSQGLNCGATLDEVDEGN